MVANNVISSYCNTWPFCLLPVFILPLSGKTAQRPENKTICLCENKTFHEHAAANFDTLPSSMRIRIPIISNVPMQPEINSTEQKRWSDLTPYLNGILSRAIPINDQSLNYVNQQPVTNSEKLKLLINSNSVTLQRALIGRYFSYNYSVCGPVLGWPRLQVLFFSAKTVNGAIKMALTSTTCLGPFDKKEPESGGPGGCKSCTRYTSWGSKGTMQLRGILLAGWSPGSRPAWGWNDNK